MKKEIPAGEVCSPHRWSQSRIPGTEGAGKDRTHRYPRELTLVEYGLMGSFYSAVTGLGGIIYMYEKD